MLKLSHPIALISHATKVMFKIPQVRLQQYVNWELPDVQAGVRKGKRTREQIANIDCIIEKAGVAIFILDRVDFEIKTMKRDKEGHYLIIKDQSKKKIQQL